MIELKVDKFENGYVTFHISRQDKEDYERLRGGRIIRYGKYRLLSNGYPEVRGWDFFVRGRDQRKNETRCCVDFNDYLDIYESIKAYNRG